FPEDDKIVKDWRGNYWFIREINGEEIRMIEVNRKNDQFRIINKRYEYEFTLPSDREGLWRLEYIEAAGDKEMEYACKICAMGSVLFVGMIGGYGDNMTIESYKLKNQNTTLDEFSRNGNITWLYKMDIETTRIGDIDVVIASREFGKENDRGRLYYYFFKGESSFYKLEHVSRGLLDYIVLNGQW
ncbi:MAG: hypothetical protein WC919_04415, partial [Candidatus Paceibacterota bacterium]